MVLNVIQNTNRINFISTLLYLFLSRINFMAFNNIHEGHRHRMREKYFKFGTEAFSDHELVEMLLYHSISRANTNDTAHRLLDRFGSIEALLSADLSSIKNVEGVGENSALLVSLVGALSKRSKIKRLSTKKKFQDINSVGNFFCEMFSGSSKEIVVAMFLDSNMRLIDVTTIAEGAIGEVSFTPAKLIREVVIKEASAVILAHNHPASASAASNADKNMTIVLEAALSTLEIPLIEHIIVSKEGYIPTMLYKPNTVRANIVSRVFGEDFFKKFYH